MTLGAVLFDLDDTLHDKSATLNRVGALQHADADLAALGIALETWLRHYIELNNQRIEKSAVFSKLASTFSLPSSLETRLLEDFDSNVGKLAVPFVGAHEIVAWCKSSGLKVGIVTNGRDAIQRSKINGMGLSNSIDATLTSGGYGVKKPDQAIFMACLERLGVQPTEAAFVGDDLQADIEPAIALGMLPIWKNIAQSERVAFSSNELPEIQVYLRNVA
jgi:putative hydrolase of the HAD superfamily